MDDAGASVNSVVVVVNGPFRFLLGACPTLPS
jgi:hypothetical protein